MPDVRYFEGNAEITVGRIRITTLLDGWLSLDGGAMYGVVPRTMWEQKLPADDRNRVRMAMRPLLVRTPDTTLVIESGIGQAIEHGLHDRYGIERTGPMLADLVRAAGVDPADINAVACTHLHWDHSGGLCRPLDGRYAPTFPNARYFCQRGEWAIAANPAGIHRASYAPASLLPIAEAGQLHTLEGDAQIAPGVRFELTAGHTENHAVIWLQDQGESACFLGDLVPTASHVPLAWISAYDLHAAASWESRERLYPRLVATAARCIFYHEPEYPVGQVVRDGTRFRFQAVT